MLKVTQLGSGRAGMKTQFSVILKPKFLHFILPRSSPMNVLKLNRFIMGTYPDSFSLKTYKTDGTAI